MLVFVFFFFFQAEDGLRGAQGSRGLGDVYKGPHPPTFFFWGAGELLCATPLVGSRAACAARRKRQSREPRRLKPCRRVATRPLRPHTPGL